MTRCRSAVGVGLGDLFEEAQELLVPVPRLAQTGDLAGGNASSLRFVRFGDKRPGSARPLHSWGPTGLASSSATTLWPGGRRTRFGAPLPSPDCWTRWSGAQGAFLHWVYLLLSEKRSWPTFRELADVLYRKRGLVPGIRDVGQHAGRVGATISTSKRDRWRGHSGGSDSRGSGVGASPTR